LLHHVKKCRGNLAQLTKNMKALDNVVSRLATNPNLQPADLVRPESKFSLKALLLSTTIFFGASAVLVSWYLR